MNRLIYRNFESRGQLDAKLASTVAQALEKAIRERGRATLVVSGGSTPLQFFQLLSQKALPWQQVTVLLADERWVAADHSDSNEKLVRDNLMVNRAAEARFLPLKQPGDDPAGAEQALDRELAALGRFDFVVLGMGGDGHTASLFPGASALASGLDMTSGKSCIAVLPTAAPHPRISLTLPRLLDSETIVVHITGNDKMAVLEQARQQDNPAELPIAAIINQDITPVSLYWAP